MKQWYRLFLIFTCLFLLEPTLAHELIDPNGPSVLIRLERKPGILAEISDPHEAIIQQSLKIMESNKDLHLLLATEFTAECPPKQGGIVNSVMSQFMNVLLATDSYKKLWGRVHARAWQVEQATSYSVYIIIADKEYLDLLPADCEK